MYNPFKRLRYIQNVVDSLLTTGVITGDVWAILTKAVRYGDASHEWKGISKIIDEVLLKVKDK